MIPRLYSSFVILALQILMTSSIIYLTWWFASCSEVWETCMLVCITQRLTLFTSFRTFNQSTGKFIIWKFGGLFPFLSKNYLPSIDSMLAATGHIPAFHQLSFLLSYSLPCFVLLSLLFYFIISFLFTLVYYFTVNFL